MKRKVVCLCLSFIVGISSIPVAAAEPLLTQVYTIDPREMEERIPAQKKDDADTAQQPETPIVGDEDKSPTEEEIRKEIEKKKLEESSNVGDSGTNVGIERPIEQVMNDAESARKKEMEQKDDSIKKQLLLKISKNRYTVKKGKTVRIKAYSSNGERVTFKSNKHKIARVNSNGKVKGLRKGTAKITIQCSSVKKTVLVTVK